MRFVATAHALLGCAMVVAGTLLLLALWRIPYAIELVFAAVVLHAGLVLAGTLRGRRAASAFVLTLAFVVAMMLPSGDAAWGVLDRVLHVMLGIVLAAMGLSRALAVRNTDGVAAPRVRS